MNFLIYFIYQLNDLFTDHRSKSAGRLTADCAPSTCFFMQREQGTQSDRENERRKTTVNVVASGAGCLSGRRKEMLKREIVLPLQKARLCTARIPIVMTVFSCTSYKILSLCTYR